MTKSYFDLTHLMTLIPNDKSDISSTIIYENICNYCGVDRFGKEIRIPAEEVFEKASHVKNLRTFQGNLLHFFDYYDTVMESTISHSNTLINSVLMKQIQNDLEVNSLKVFIKMTRNFIDQFDEVELQTSHFNDLLLDNLCDGNLGNALKMVPSRELARQLGVSDQKLRREIYLARQRATKKRPSPDDESNDNIQFEKRILLPNIPTCASPLSSDSLHSENFLRLDLDQFQLVESELEGWQSWLNIDMIEL